MKLNKIENYITYVAVVDGGFSTNRCNGDSAGDLREDSFNHPLVLIVLYFL